MLQVSGMTPITCLPKNLSEPQDDSYKVTAYNEAGEILSSLECEFIPIGDMYASLERKEDKEKYAPYQQQVLADGTIVSWGTRVELCDDMNFWETSKYRLNFTNFNTFSQIQEDPIHYLQTQMGITSPDSSSTTNKNIPKTPEQTAVEAREDAAVKEQMQSICQKISDAVAEKAGYKPNEVTLTHGFFDNSFNVRFECDTFTRFFYDKFYEQIIADDPSISQMVKQLESLMSTLYGQDKKVNFKLE